MGVRFVSASAQTLTCATHPITAFPVTVGLWVRPLTAATRGLWSLGDSGVATQYIRLGQNATGNTWNLSAQSGGTSDTLSIGVATASQWAFMVGRFISATNKRLSVLQYDGSIVGGQRTTSRAFPTSADSIVLGSTVGGTAEWNGYLAEVWYTNTDIQADGGVLSEATLRQLAYGGPFSVPHIAKDIIEYRSFRKGLISNTDEEGEVYSGKNGRQTWTNTNGATLDIHPPLPGWYKRPGAEVIQFRRPRIIAATGAAAAAPTVTYPMLERGLRGVTRGAAIGSYH